MEIKAVIDLNGRDFSLSIEQAQHMVYSAYDTHKPDPAWSYQDSAGHVHRWDLALKNVPTLKRVIDDIIVHCNDGDTWEEVIDHLECSECGERIAPKTLIDVPAGMPQSVPGLQSISGDVILHPGEEYLINHIGEGVLLKHGDLSYKAYITGWEAWPSLDPIPLTYKIVFGGGLPVV